MNIKEVKIEKTDNTSLKLIICGDTVATEKDLKAFANEDISVLLHNGLSDVLFDADYRIFNLEAPITDSKTRLFKPGAPHLASPSDCFSFFQKMRPCGLSCANNHIKDFGITGIKDTEDICKESNIHTLGVSSISSSEANNALYIHKGDHSCIVYSLAENEFSIATESEGGANGYDPLNTFDDIRYLSQTFSIPIIILFHGGRENYKYPSPELKKIAKKMIECGARVVICQHSHCIGCIEKVDNGVIIYGQGNFIFNRTEIESWKTGLIISLRIINDSVSINYIPVKRDYVGIRRCSSSEDASIFEEINKRNEQIKSIDFVRNNWRDFCNSQKTEFLLGTIYGIKSKYIKALDRKTNGLITNILFKNREKRNLIINFMRCESILESLKTILDDDSWKEGHI